jgi:hypothetical protein
MAADSQGGVSGTATHGNMGWWYSAGGVAAGSGSTVSAAVTSLDTGFLSVGKPYPKNAEDSPSAKPWLYSTLVDVPLGAEALYLPVQQGVYVNRYSVTDVPSGSSIDDAAWQQLPSVDAAGPVRTHAPGAVSFAGLDGATLVSTQPSGTGGLSLLAVADPGATQVILTWSAALGALQAFDADLDGAPTGAALPASCDEDTCSLALPVVPAQLVSVALLPAVSP